MTRPNGATLERERTVGIRYTSVPDFTITIRRTDELDLEMPLVYRLTGLDAVMDIHSDLITTEGARVLQEAFTQALRDYWLPNQLRLLRGGQAGDVL